MVYFKLRKGEGRLWLAASIISLVSVAGLIDFFIITQKPAANPPQKQPKYTSSSTQTLQK